MAFVCVCVCVSPVADEGLDEDALGLIGVDIIIRNLHKEKMEYEERTRYRDHHIHFRFTDHRK
jgi:hypothetical protein